MKFNAFEGARRILYLTMVLVAVGGAIFIYNIEHTPSMTFNIKGAGFAPVYAETQWDCESGDRRGSEVPEFSLPVSDPYAASGGGICFGGYLWAVSGLYMAAHIPLRQVFSGDGASRI